MPALGLPLPRVWPRLDLKVPRLRLLDDPIGHEGHRQAGRRVAPMRSRECRRRVGTAREGKIVCSFAALCVTTQKCRRALPQNEIGSATIIKGPRRGHQPRNPAWVRAWSVPWKGDIYTSWQPQRTQRSGRRREAIDRGDGEPLRERDGSPARRAARSRRRSVTSELQSLVTLRADVDASKASTTAKIANVVGVPARRERLGVG